jgi:hypothetical protein
MYGHASGTGSPPALANLQPPDLSAHYAWTNRVGSTSRWMVADQAWEGVQSDRPLCTRLSPCAVAAAEGLWPTTGLKTIRIA